MKDFRFNERHALQFRMEMFNAPNHPAWGSPSASWGIASATRDGLWTHPVAPANCGRFSSH